MFSKILDFFSGGTKEQKPTENPIADKLKDKVVTEVTGVTVTATAKPKTANKYTKANLEKLTKVALEEIGRSEFGVELDRRLKKEDLIKQLLKEQKAQK